VIRLRDAAAALIDDEAIRQEWLDLEWRMMLVMGAYRSRGTSTRWVSVGAKGTSISEEEANRRHFLRAQIIAQVLHRVRSGEWTSQYFQDGSLTPTPLSADWWKRRTYLDPYNETVPWKDGELTGLMVEERAPVGAVEAPEPADAPRQASEQSGSTASQPQGKRGRPPGSPERDRIVEAIRKDIYEKKTHALGRNRSGGLTLVELLGDGTTSAPMKQGELEKHYKADRGTLGHALRLVRSTPA
jgi:hypothetical protein